MGRCPQFGRKDVGIPRIPSIISQDGLEAKSTISPSIALAAVTNESMNFRLAWDSALAAMSVNGGAFLDATNFPAHDVRTSPVLFSNLIDITATNTGGLLTSFFQV